MAANKKRNPARPEDVPLKATFTVPEAAKYLGKSPNAIYYQVRQGNLLKVGIGYGTRIPREEIVRWLESHTAA